jgi:hypothetical protein
MALPPPVSTVPAKKKKLNTIPIPNLLKSGARHLASQRLIASLANAWTKDLRNAGIELPPEDEIIIGKSKVQSAQVGSKIKQIYS